MADAIDAPPTVRTLIPNRRQTADIGAQADESLARQSRPRSPADDAAARLTGDAARGRAGALARIKNAADGAIGAVDAAVSALEASAQLSAQARRLAVAAHVAENAPERAAIAEEFNAVIRQIDTVARAAGYAGINLLRTPPDDLQVPLNGDGANVLTISGTDASARALGLAPATFATPADAEASIAQAEAAEVRSRAAAASFASDLTRLQARLDFNDNLAQALDATPEGFALDVLSEESADRLAATTGQVIGTNALSLAPDSQRSILSLFD